MPNRRPCIASLVGFILSIMIWGSIPAFLVTGSDGWAQTQSEGGATIQTPADPGQKPPLPAPVQPGVFKPSLAPMPGQMKQGPALPAGPGMPSTRQSLPLPPPTNQPQQQQDPAVPASPGPSAVQASPTPFQPAAAPALRRGQFAMNFDDADVYTIIQTIFGEILRVNYVVDPRIKGRVTFRATAPVPIENVLPLMEVILRLNGIGVVEENGLYRLVPISDLSKEPSPVSYGRDPEKIAITGKALLQVVPIVYVQSSDAIKLITPFASNNAVLIDVPKGNQIIIVDTDANVKRMLKLVEVFDNERLKQRKPQVFVYAVQNSKAKDIATLLQQIFLGGKTSTGDAASPPSRTATGGPSTSTSATPSAAGSSQPQISVISAGGSMLVSDFTKFIPDEIANTVIVLSTPEEYAMIKETMERIDTVPRQVVIEGMIASVSLTDNLSLGIAAFLKGSIRDFDVRVGMNATSMNADLTIPMGSGFSFYGIDSVGKLQFLVQALAQDSKAKLLATPHILVSDNKEAKIQVGQQVPLLTSETYGAVGVTPQRNYQYRDIGIILKVKPRVNEGGLVSLEISQEISTSEKVTLGGTEQLLLNKTEASTSLVVQDGQTIVIGGLIREDASKGREGLPFLSKIPILGWLFGTTTDDKKRQELIILLTPHVIKNQNEAKAMSDDYIDNMAEKSGGRIMKGDLSKERPLRKEGVKPPDAPRDKLPESP